MSELAAVVIAWARMITGVSNRTCDAVNAARPYLPGISAGEPIGDFLASWKDALAAVQSIATILALLIGGMWAYFKVFRGRIYSQRLEPTIDAKILHGENYSCSIIEVTIKNVGLTRVDLDRESSTINMSIYTYNNYEPEFHNAIWTDLGTISALQHHSWVEPGETVTEERLLALPNENLIAIGVRLRLLPKAPIHALWRRRTEWNALAVAALEGTDSPLPTHKLAVTLKATESES